MLLPLRKNSISFQSENIQIHPQIFDLLQMSRLEKDCAERFRQKLKTLKSGGNGKKSVCYPSIDFFKGVEKRHLLKQTREAAKFYLFVRRERMKSFDRYMNGIVPRNRYASLQSEAPY